MIELSVVIPTFNRRSSLEVVLPSLLQQTIVPERYEILLCDAGSVDGTDELVRELNAGERIRFSPGGDSGRAGARNRGLREARGELVLFTDADIIAEPGLLQAHADRHARRPGCAVVGCEIQVQSLDEYQEFRKSPQSHARHRPSRQTLPWHYFLTGNASAGRQLLVDVGGFDEAFQGYGHEDLELGYRLARRGTPLLYAPEAINYHWHPVPFDEQCRKMYLAGRSTVTFYRKHKDRRIQLTLGWNPFSTLWHKAMPAGGWLYRQMQQRTSSSHGAREVILQHHYLSGIRSALSNQA